MRKFIGLPGSEERDILSWCENPEQGAVDQAKNLSQLPFLVSHVALMPDTHVGYGVPIGGVVGLSGVVIPNAVGVDIGCGMRAVKSTLRPEEVDVDGLKMVLQSIRDTIPLGFKHHATARTGMPDFSGDLYYGGAVCDREYSSAEKQLGTLGGGNHFIEIQKSATNVWVMIHSGSRNLGKQVADHYNKEAKELNVRWHTKVDPKWDLAFLPLDSEEGRRYVTEMDYCLAFAEANRAHMMSRVRDIMATIMSPCAFGDELDVHHNYTRMEHHFGRDVMVHRKGATSARAGELGIIPGSQGTASYIVRGLGNPASLTSCSHGAGRRMGRKAAVRDLNLAEQQELLESQGILHAVRGAGDLDEAPGAYKDIATVMAEQRDLVEVVEKLRPMAVVKG